MATPNQNSLFSEYDELLNDPDFCRAMDALSDCPWIMDLPSPMLSASSTPDPLNTAFLHETNINEQSQSSVSSQQQRYITNEISSAMSDLIETVLEYEHETIDLHFTRPTTTEAATATAATAATATTATTTAPTATAPTTTAPTATSSIVEHEVIDLCTPTPHTIDLMSTSSPSEHTIDLCTPPTTTSTTHHAESSPHLAPK